MLSCGGVCELFQQSQPLPSPHVIGVWNLSAQSISDYPAPHDSVLSILVQPLGGWFQCAAMHCIVIMRYPVILRMSICIALFHGCFCIWLDRRVGTLPYGGTHPGKIGPMPFNVDGEACWVYWTRAVACICCVYRSITSAWKLEESYFLHCSSAYRKVSQLWPGKQLSTHWW